MINFRQLEALKTLLATGSTIATETEVETIFDTASTSLLPNLTLETLSMTTWLPSMTMTLRLQRGFRQLLPMRRSNAAFASTRSGATSFPMTKSIAQRRCILGLRAFKGQSHFRAGSTDVGDVSRVTPTAQCWAPAWAIGTNPHTWQVVAQGRSLAAYKRSCMLQRCWQQLPWTSLHSPNFLLWQKSSGLKKWRVSDMYAPFPRTPSRRRVRAVKGSAICTPVDRLPFCSNRLHRIEPRL